MAAAAMKHMALSFAKLEKFKGVDFKRWQKKMHFMLSSMSVMYVLTTPMPKDGGENPTVEQVRNRAKWDNDNYVCKGLILNGMSDSLFDIYQNVETSKELWDTLEARYIADDASSKKFLISNFTNYEMTDLRPVLEQYNKLLEILRSHLRIKESLRVHDSDKPKGNNVVGPSVVNMKYGKPGHLKKDCKAGNVGNSANGSSIKGSEDGSSNPLKDRCWFKTYESLNDGSILYMENESTALVHGCGCVDLRAAVRLPDPKLKTLGERGIECIFVRYAEHSRAFRFYVIKSSKSVTINSIIELRDDIFDEQRFSSVPRPSQRSLKESINDEMDSIMGNNTWVLTDLPPGIDYFDTYALVTRISTIRLLIAMTSIHNLISHQMDVKIAFLNEELEERVYMHQPLGFIMLGNENKVCKLIKSLYGLKQAPKQWNQKFNEVVLSNGYLLNQADKYVYSKFDASGKGVIICLYVDDMLIFGTDQVQVDLTKEFLSLRFFMKDMGEEDVILGIRIKHESNGIVISQSHCIEKVLKKFNYFDCTPVSTPLDTCEKLMPNKGLAVSQLEYSC
nr:zinc finger, CCHC-type [Tanacetum cinerariifolium]